MALKSFSKWRNQYYFLSGGQPPMNRKKPAVAGTGKREKGQQVFGDNADEVLAKKIIAHSRKSTGDSKAGKQVHNARPKEPAAPKPAFTYRTPEEKLRTKTTGYGIAAAFAGLVVLGIGAVLWSRLKKD
jgi:hypothetical protein